MALLTPSPHQLPPTPAQEATVRRFEVTEFYEVKDDKWVLQLRHRLSWPTCQQVRLPAIPAALCCLAILSAGRLHAPPWLMIMLTSSMSSTIMQFLSPFINYLYRKLLRANWTVDSQDGHFEYKGNPLQGGDVVKCVRAWKVGEGKFNARLAVEFRRSDPVVIAQYGTWEEYAALAERLADYARVPLRLGPLP